MLQPNPIGNTPVFLKLPLLILFVNLRANSVQLRVTFSA